LAHAVAKNVEESQFLKVNSLRWQQEKLSATRRAMVKRSRLAIPPALPRSG